MPHRVLRRTPLDAACRHLATLVATIINQAPNLIHGALADRTYNEIKAKLDEVLAAEQAVERLDTRFPPSLDPALNMAFLEALRFADEEAQLLSPTGIAFEAVFYNALETAWNCEYMRSVIAILLE
ncbi:hypothetical protein BC828DRAFT_403918 [Blastocladiella britannica]|nr:hypothetical protein BC828DRAFT_403918 [Blastocladiella britannica]